MELFTNLFSDLLVLVYHCFDQHCHPRLFERSVTPGAGRILLSPGRRRSGGEQRGVSQRTTDYQNWVEAFARNHNIPMEWAEKGVRKEDYVQPWLRKMVRKNAYGVYSIKSMEQGPSFRVMPNFPTKIPITAFWPGRRAVSPTTTSTSATKCSAPSSCVWRRSFPSRRRITSTATATSSRTQPSQNWLSQKRQRLPRC